MTQSPSSTVAPLRLGLAEFTALMAMMTASVAFSIDSMLPAMGVIADELTSQDPNRAQLIISVFFLGLGAGTLFAGPIADAIGRRATIMAGMSLYCVGAWLAWMAPTLELVLLARVIQGIGVAGPRVATLAVVRDLYGGRDMARIMSLIMMVFSFVPAAAPLIGEWIMTMTGWRGIFLAFIVFAFTVTTWFAARQPETLPRAARRRFSLSVIVSGLVEALSMRLVRLTILAQAFAFTIIVLMISTTQQVFDQTFDRAAEFPEWFAAISVLSASAGFLNARFVTRFGMRRMVSVTFAAQMLLSAGMTICVLAQIETDLLFLVYLVWVWSAFMTAGFTIGNLNALGMMPLGHMAGLGGSLIVSMATIGSVAIAAPAGRFFDGTPLAQSVTLTLCSVAGLFVMRQIKERDVDTSPA